MKHNYNWNTALLFFTLLFTGSALNAQMYISEVMFTPSGSDIPLEFIELRGPVSGTIPANTYIMIAESDQESDEGKVKSMFDVSGLSFGANGYFAFVMDGSPYTLDPDANVRVASSLALDEEGWQGEPLYTSDSGDKEKEWESASVSFLLVTTDVTLSSRPDLDDDDDGAIDSDYDSWTFHDGVALLDDDGTEVGYAPIIFKRNTLDNLIAPSDAYSYATSFNPSYVARIGESTGSTGNDWLAVGGSSGGTNGLSGTSRSDEAFDNIDVTTVGTVSYLADIVTYTTGSLVPADIDSDEDLIIDGDFTTSDDFVFHALTVTAGNTLTIADAGSMKVSGGLTNEGTIIVESGGTLWTYEGKESDEATFQRNTTYDDTRYSMIGLPIEEDLTITGSSIGGILYSYDETVNYDVQDGLNRWINASSTVIQPGAGYAHANQELISVTGIPNQGTIEIDVTHTVAGSATVANRGFNLVSNPYASAIEGDEFFTENSNISSSIYIWDDGGTDDVARRTNSDYIIANSAGYCSGGSDRIMNGVSPRYEGDIRAFQGFFVHIPDAGGLDVAETIVFTEDMRQTGNNNDGRFFRTSADAFPTLTLGISTTEGFYNETVVSLLNDATSGWDRMYDAIKPRQNSDLQLYSVLDGTNYAIQGLPIENDISTEIAFDLGADAQLALSVKAMENLADGMTFLLYDKLTEKVYNLNEIESLDFYAESGLDQNRFTLTYSSSSVLATELSQVQPIYNYVNNALNITFSQSIEIMGYAVYDLNGKVLTDSKNSSVNRNSIAIPSNIKGLNIVKVITSEGTFTRKFLF